MSPLFSVIVTHYQPHHTDDELVRGLTSIAAPWQDIPEKDLEIILLHDGPLERPLPVMPEEIHAIHVIINEPWYGHRGAALRRRGLEEAEGEYIVMFDADNELHGGALSRVAQEFPADMVIMAMRVNGRVITGEPPAPDRIDTMQAVVRREFFLEHGGWNSDERNQDGIIYQNLAAHTQPKYIRDVLCSHLSRIHS